MVQRVAGRRSRSALAVAFALLCWVAPPSGAEPRERFDRVVLDAGHGGDDEGARGPRGLLEKELVLDVARRLADRLREAGVKVVLTREGDRFVGLEERTSIANDARADLFVSIHANGSRASEARGVETYFASLEASDEESRRLADEENEALGAVAPASRAADDPLAAILGDMIATEHLADSQEFALLALRSLGNGAARSRGVKQAPFVVLLGVQMPATLVEIGFVTNAREEQALRAGDERDRIADRLANAILDFGRRYDERRGVARTTPGTEG